MKKIVAILICITATGLCSGQRDTSYNSHDYFAESFSPPPGTVYRSAAGIPGPMYWQNHADYTIHALLSEKDTSITGDVSIHYVNNSPDSLDELWLQLDQNLFEPGSRGAAKIPASGDNVGVLGNHGGYQISGVLVTYMGKSYPVKPVITDTRMQIRLKNKLRPGGDQIRVAINYHFEIPAYGADRMGRVYTKNAVVYTIAQWYPRVCVYDDVQGWNTLPYLGLGEFYCEYGDIDYYITAPAEMIVYGSGDLQNAGDVLTSDQIQRLSLAAKSDKTVSIVNASEAGLPSARPVSGRSKTWHYKMANTRDVAWAASQAMVWDAARVNLPSGKKALAMSAYPVESVGDTAWSRSTEYLKYSMEIYSRDYFEYPWHVAVNIGSNITGMEYPGMIFNDYKSTRAPLWFVITHEIGHNWYPMIVGSNERKYMWQDEGFNSFINYRANEIFNEGEYAKDPALFNKNHFAWFDVNTMHDLKDPLMTVSDAMDMAQHYQYYSKTAYGLNLLRNTIIGRERFDYAFRKYTDVWAFKHPTPYDFFHCINSAAGEDLNWFWKQWFFTTWTLDQSIKDVQLTGNDPAEETLITIENKGKMIMPLFLQVIHTNGQSDTLRLPVEIWQGGKIWTIKLPSGSRIKKINIDPENLLPDINRSNNEWNSPK